MNPVQAAYAAMFAAFKGGDRFNVAERIQLAVMATSILLPFPKPEETEATKRYMLDMNDIARALLSDEMTVVDAHVLVKAKVDDLLMVAWEGDPIMALIHDKPKKMGSA
jgi:hypothetical protein